ncbi:MAG: hypothetical protein AB7P76_06895 [Candidatus Melainabacteria bacterium]
MSKYEFTPNSPKHPHDWSTDALIVMFLMLGILTPYLVVYQNTPLILMLVLTIGMLMLLFIGFVVGKIARTERSKKSAFPQAAHPQHHADHGLNSPVHGGIIPNKSDSEQSKRRFSVRY